jgi:hypothetical protein
MKADLRISIKDYCRGNNLKIQLLQGAFLLLPLDLDTEERRSLVVD